VISPVLKWVCTAGIIYENASIFRIESWKAIIYIVCVLLTGMQVDIGDVDTVLK